MVTQPLQFQIVAHIIGPPEFVEQAILGKVDGFGHPFDAAGLYPARNIAAGQRYHFPDPLAR
jgi:hypothetical protein